MVLKYEQETHSEPSQTSTPWTQDANWTYVRRSEDVLDVFWKSYVRSIYVLCPGRKMELFSQKRFMLYVFLCSKCASMDPLQ